MPTHRSIHAVIVYINFYKQPDLEIDHFQICVAVNDHHVSFTIGMKLFFGDFLPYFIYVGGGRCYRLCVGAE